jgi:hypothetical protein
LISLIISERWKTDPMNREFDFESNKSEIQQLPAFFDCILNRDVCNFSRESEIRILSICQTIGNDRLSLSVLGSVYCDISCKSSLSSLCESGSSEKVRISEMSVEDCAFQFSLYSASELRTPPK